MQAQLDDARRAAASVGLVIRPRQFALPVADAEPDTPSSKTIGTGATSSSERRLSSSSLSASKTYYLTSRDGMKCVLQIHDASGLPCDCVFSNRSHNYGLSEFSYGA